MYREHAVLSGTLSKIFGNTSLMGQQVIVTLSCARGAPRGLALLTAQRQIASQRWLTSSDDEVSRSSQSLRLETM